MIVKRRREAHYALNRKRLPHIYVYSFIELEIERKKCRLTRFFGNKQKEAKDLSGKAWQKKIQYAGMALAKQN